MNPMDFTAIDFETANPNSQSACQLGLAVVQNGLVVERKTWLIRPPADRFDFTYIHGLTWKHVAGEPDFGRLWAQIAPYLENRIIAAHNTAFDMGVLFSLIRLYRLDFWKGGTLDSVLVARKVWPFLDNHQLKTVSSHLGIPLVHHNAVSDANACAEIIIRAELEKTGIVAKSIRWDGNR